jgi:hypothetical protein
MVTGLVYARCGGRKGGVVSAWQTENGCQKVKGTVKVKAATALPAWRHPQDYIEKENRRLEAEQQFWAKEKIHVFQRQFRLHSVWFVVSFQFFDEACVYTLLRN